MFVGLTDVTTYAKNDLKTFHCFSRATCGKNAGFRIESQRPIILHCHALPRWLVISYSTLSKSVDVSSLLCDFAKKFDIILEAVT